MIEMIEMPSLTPTHAQEQVLRWLNAGPREICADGRGDRTSPYLCEHGARLAIRGLASTGAPVLSGAMTLALAEHGWIERAPSPGWRKHVCLILTNAGRAVLALHDPARVTASATVLRTNADFGAALQHLNLQCRAQDAARVMALAAVRIYCDNPAVPFPLRLIHDTGDAMLRAEQQVIDARVALDVQRQPRRASIASDDVAPRHE